MLPSEFNPALLRQLEMLRIGSQRAFLGQRQGMHLSLKRGQGIEFSDYRKYELGDNPRAIDWGLYARSERLYIKRYREEQSLTAMMVMDTSPSMFVERDDISNWMVSRNLAIAIAYVALMKQDSVYVGATSGIGLRFSGASAIHRISDALMMIKPQQPLNFSREVMRIASQARFPGIVYLFSDLLYPFEEISRVFNSFLARNMELTVVRVRSKHDQSPLDNLNAANVIDSETGEQLELGLDARALDAFQHRLKLHLDQVRLFCSQRRVRFLEIPCERSLPEIVHKDFVASGILV
jgi:uncharacterized protein (DUF58 family)